MGMEDDLMENDIKEYPIACEQHFVTDLISQLTTILNDKARLEKENITLKSECKELMEKLSEYEHNMEKEKYVFLEEFKNFKAKKGFHHQEEQNKYLTEVHNLKMSYYKHKDLCAKKEQELVNKIKFLKVKVEENENNYTAMRELAVKNKKKYNSYKAKVKFARGVIKKLIHKPLAANKGCQTEIKDKRLCNAQEDNVDRRTENGILAKLFFKQFPYNKDNESFTLD